MLNLHSLVKFDPNWLKNYVSFKIRLFWTNANMLMPNPISHTFFIGRRPGFQARPEFFATCMVSVTKDPLWSPYILLSYRVVSPKHFCNIFNNSVAISRLDSQNFLQTRSIFVLTQKIARQTFDVVNKWLPNPLKLRQTSDIVN